MFSSILPSVLSWLMQRNIKKAQLLCLIWFKSKILRLPCSYYVKLAAQQLDVGQYSHTDKAVITNTLCYSAFFCRKKSECLLWFAVPGFVWLSFSTITVCQCQRFDSHWHSSLHAISLLSVLNMFDRFFRQYALQPKRQNLIQQFDDKMMLFLSMIQ